jgi:ligand-binding sensor domain-containing protein
VGAISGGTWQSWSAANDIYAMTLFKDELISGGPGGVTRWNLAKGAVAGRLTTGNGLPGPYVLALLVDDQGQTLWIGTDSGLAAYDGQSTRVYNAKSGLDSSNVSALARGKRGLMAGTQYSRKAGGGLNLLVNDHWQPVAGFPSSDNTDTAPNQLSSNVTALLEDSQGIDWVGTTNGLGRYDGKTWTRYSTADGLPDNNVNALLEVDGTLWAATNSGVAEFVNNAFVATPEADGDRVLGLFRAGNGDLWLVGAGGMLRRSNSGSWQTYNQSQFPAGQVTSGIAVTNSAIYLGSDAGVLRFDGKTFDLWAVPNVPSRTGYWHILVGPTAGSLWFDENYGAVTNLMATVSDTWARGPDLGCDQSCLPLAWGPDGRLWAAGDDGAWVFKGTQGTHLTTTVGLPEGRTAAVAFARDGSTWIGTENGAAVYKGSGVTVVYSSTNAGLADDKVAHLLADSDGSMWVATGNDLSRFTPDGKWVHYGPGDPFQDDVEVSSLAQDKTGAVWVGTYGEGAYRFAGGVWTQFRPGVNGVKLPSSQVQCITPAGDGSIWFGTAGAGAARFDGANWQAFTVADGLINGDINDIYVEANRTIWFATSGGVSALKP